MGPEIVENNTVKDNGQMAMHDINNYHTTINYSIKPNGYKILSFVPFNSFVFMFLWLIFGINLIGNIVGYLSSINILNSKESVTFILSFATFLINNYILLGLERQDTQGALELKDKLSPFAIGGMILGFYLMLIFAVDSIIAFCVHFLCILFIFLCLYFENKFRKNMKVLFS